MKNRPNIVIILTDQQNSNMMSCTGNEYVKTPSLDKLASEGMRFTQAVCANPVCIPSRFSLFTGYLPSKIGMRCNEDARKISPVPKDILSNGMGFLLQRAGYKAYYGGKEHFPRFNSRDIGFDYFCRDERDKLAQESAAFLKNKYNEPFILVVSFINPHDICYMAIDDFRQSSNPKKKIFKKYNSWYKKIELLNVNSLLDEGLKSLRLNTLPNLPSNHEPQQDEPEAVRSLFKRTFRKYAREEWDVTKWKLHRYIYSKLTETVDSQIGQVLTALEEGPNANDTVVIFTSDHGDHDSSHKLEHKTALYSEAVKIPFIIKWNNVIPKGAINSQIINNGLDLLPTVCEIAKIKPPDYLIGKSIINIARSGENNSDRLTPIESEIGSSIWSKDWVYVMYDHGDYREQLYDLKNDPGQTRNYIEDHQEILEKFRGESQKYWPNL